jgi:hypothetical protein
MEIAKGVGYRCSNPECARPTVGANASQDGTVTIGVAAHICAASPGGPRYSAVQTRQARRARDNGIWLCQNCGRLIDADAQKFTVEILTGWKRAAQDRAFRELVAPETSARREEAARIDSIMAADNADSADADVDRLFEKVLEAARADLSAHMRAPIWSGSSVELTLRVHDDPTAPSFTISKLPAAVEIAPEVVVVALPGTGKTTTLLQLVAQLLAANTIIPLYFRLGDWTGDPPSLLASVNQRSAFRHVSQGDLLRLIEHGRVLLLLDGWNELDDTTRRKLRLEVQRIRHECPNARIIAATRRQVLDVPISGPRIAIEPLSEDQQMAIARERFGAAGAKIVDEAWRTAGVRELISTPLYLSALLSTGSHGTSPTTKEEVLRLFVEQHERASDHAEALLATLFGCHPQILIALASHLNGIGSTTMSEADARRIVATTVAALRDEGQILGLPEPLAVLEVLASHHALMRSGTGNGAISFQHQQFQEWYASHEVAGLMRASASGEISARVRLRAAVFDRPAWAESIFFAVERVSREQDGAAVVAHAVHLALAIDPMLAAEMIYRASVATWEIIKIDILAFVDRWHRPGNVDRAIRFMIMTGRPEFESRIWPLVASSDSQVQLPTLRTAPRFRPSVLGPDVRSKVATLPETTRQNLIGEIASESGVDGMDLAAELAKADPSPQVQAVVIQNFQFRHAARHVADILASAHDETWALLAKRGFADDIYDPAAMTRLQIERDKAFALATDPLERFRLLLDQPPNHPGRDAAIAAAIADPKFPVRDQHGGASLYLAQERAPTAILQGLRQRLEAGLQLPFHADDLLREIEVIDVGPIATRILDVSHDDRDTDRIAVVAGPKTVNALVDHYLTRAQALKSDRGNRDLNDEYNRLRSRISATRAPSFVAALMIHANSADPLIVASLASLVSFHGGSSDRMLPLPVHPAIKPELIDLLRTWVEVVTESPGSERYQLNDVSNAIGRFGFRELVPELKRLLDEDLLRLNRAIEGRSEARRRGDIRATSDASMRYGNQYREAFSRIGGEEAAVVAAQYLENRVFGSDAALILKALSDKQLNLPEPDFRRQWPWFDEVGTARAARAAAPRPQPANVLAEPIFAAIDRLAKPETENTSQLLAIDLARIALAMPHSNQDALIARVMALPQPIQTKRGLLAAIALDGLVLEVNVVMQGVYEWLQRDSRDAWHRRQNTWEIEPWLELLPYTNQPEWVIDGLTKVKAFYGTGWAKRWPRVLTAVAALPGNEGEALLAALAYAHKDIAGDFEWMKAILGRDSAAAVLLYVDLFIEGVFGQGPEAADLWHGGRELAAYVRKFPQLEAALKQRYEAIGTGAARALLEHLFGELGDDDDLIAMIQKYAATRQPYDGRMDAAIRATALRNEPVEDGSNSLYIYPASIARIRKHLFGLLRGAPHEAALAKNCLIATDVLRDDYGIAPDDPRHPDLSSERPWPSEARGPE